MFEHSGEVLFLVEAEDDGRFRFLAVNPTFAGVTGLPPSVVAGSLVNDVIPAASVELVLGYYRQALQTGRPATWIEESAYPTGTRTGHVIVVPVVDAASGRRFLAGSVRDLTGERRSEERARTTTAQLRAIFEHAGDAMLLTDDAGACLEANAAATTLFGYSREELLARNVSELVSAPEHARALRQQFLAQGRLAGECELLRKDGTMVMAEFSAITHISPGLHLTMGRDISARKQAEEAVRRSESRYRSVIEHGPVVFFATDAAGTFVVCEGKGLAAAGVEPQQIVGRSAFDTYGSLEVREPDGRMTTGAEALRRVMAGETVRGVTHLAGAYYDNTFIPAHGQDGTPDGMIGIAADITALVRTATTLHERSELFRAMIERGSDIISLHDADGTMRYQSPSITPILGYEPAELVGQPVLAFIHPEDREAAAAQAEAIRSRPGVHPPFETRFRHRDGSWRWFQCRGTNLLDDPTVRSVVFNSQDITARKAADRALRHSEEHFRTLIEKMSDVVTVIDADGVISYESPSVARVLGHQPSELVGRAAWDFVHPDDQPVLRQALAGGAVSNNLAYHYRFRHADGSWRILESVGRLVHESGAAVTAVIVSRDVTERTRAERDARLLQEVARELTEANDADTAIVATLRLVCEGQGWDFAEAWFPDSDGETLTQCPLWHGGPLFDKIRSAGTALHLRPGEGLPGEAWRRGAAVYSRDVSSDTLFARSAEARAIGLRTAVAVPGRAGDESHRILLVLHFAALEERVDDEQQNALLGVVTSQLGTAIQRKRTETAWRRTDRLLKTVVNGAPIIVFAIDGAGTFTMSEGRGLEVLALAPGEVVGRSAFEVGRDYPDVLRDLRRVLRGEAFVSYADVAGRTFQTWYSPVPAPDGGPPGAVGVSMDITERRQLEDQLRQAHKLESIGLLAGGIAHDFNNLLMVIIGYSELVLAAIDEGAPWRHELEQIEKAGQRASALTQQLLAFSRKQMLQPRSVDLNEVVRDVARMLQRLIGENIELCTELAPDLHRIRADPNQMEQVLMNLAVNARDAMAHGGRLVITTENVAEHAAAEAASVAGRAVRLSVSDTGVGMTEAVRKRVFEPFFTTKPVGKGTGMGLATVYGIVKQSGGEVAATSIEGEGTVLTITLPVEGAPEIAAADARDAAAPRGAERVLLVEDEVLVRQLAVRTLQSLGYEVAEAADGAEALQLYTASDRPFDLLITDVVMPHMSGPELVDRILTLNSRMKVLYISGYADDTVLRHGMLRHATHFLQKPFSAPVLARTVREALDTP